MSESDGEKAARSVALEQAYVHEVYEQCAEKTAQSRHWPRIYKFLEELEPGALVCDIGCGNGKYLSVNDNVFKVGADRCKRLTDIAREKENEVLMCDNLALPFRDESFDAVLSIAVVHHFATTERRVNALKELARVLRIGGRLVISVWAMEQRHRKFESQDVLVPWPKAYYLNSESNAVCPGGKTSAGGMPCINEIDPDRISQKCLLTSKRNGGRKCKSRSYWIDPIFTPSPSTSSLSSPNETCYSFFRRALQKLAGGKRGSGNRAWFLENWQNGGSKNDRNYETDDIGDVDDIPIELRRLEDDNVVLNKIPDALSVKSKSLGDILEIQRIDLVRSRSSIPGFSSTVTSELYLDDDSKTPSPSPTPPPPPPPPLPPTSGSSVGMPTTERMRIDDRRSENSTSPKSSTDSFSRSLSSSGKPRLVKQKTHIPDDATIEFSEKPKNTATRDIVTDIADIQKTDSLRERRRNVHKQSSMNEELMSMERLIERDRVRRNIMKQASLNEEIICKPNRTFGNFRDSIMQSGNATKRFQLIKSGLTNRIKQSTTSMEKVSSLALKNGFVKILQGWTSSDSQNDETLCPSNDEKSNSENFDENKILEKDSSSKFSKNVQGGCSTNANVSSVGKMENEVTERRSSREDGSDSSKDSSLQSDTSVDSEDSFASVIYVPKPAPPPQQQQRVDYHNHYQQQQHHNRMNQQSNLHNHQNHNFPSLIDVTTVPVGCYQLRTTSAPPSPRIKHPPDTHGPRIKLISISPLLKQFPATSKSLPPPSPPGLSPRNLNPFNDSRPFFPSSENPSFDSVTTIVPVNSDSRENEDSTEINAKQSNDDDNFQTTNSRSPETFARDEKGSNVIVEEKIGIVKSFDEIRTVESDSVAEISVNVENRKSTSTIEETIGKCAIATTIDSTERKDNIDNFPSIVTKIAATITKSVASEFSGDEKSEKSEKSSTESINDDECRRTRLNQIKELLRQKPGFATRTVKSPFPLVRRASTATSGRPETIDARTLPRLLSLELYNPETDDLDSDSSGLSSPESVGSVISVISDERFTIKKDGPKSGDSEKIAEPEKSESTTRIKIGNTAETGKTTTTTMREIAQSTPPTERSNSNVSRTQSLRFFEAAASVANSLQDTVGTAVIRLEPHQRRNVRNVAEPTTTTTMKNLDNAVASRNSRTVNETSDSRNSGNSKISRIRERLDAMPEETIIPHDDDRRDSDDKISNDIINDIERYCQNTRLLDDTETTSDTDESTKTTIARGSKYFDNSSTLENSTSRKNSDFTTESLDLLPGVNRLRNNCKYSRLVDDTIAWLRAATGPENDDYRNYADGNEITDENRPFVDDTGPDGEPVDDETCEKSEESSIKSANDDMMDFVMVSKNGDCISMGPSMDGETVEIGETSEKSKFEFAKNSRFDENAETTVARSVVVPDNGHCEITGNSGSCGTVVKNDFANALRYGDSSESTEIDVSVGNSASVSSEPSQTESIGKSNRRSVGNVAAVDACGSTTSLGSSNHDYKTLRERRKYLYQKRSASEEIPGKNFDGRYCNRNNEINVGGRKNGISPLGSSMGLRRSAERCGSSTRTPNLSGSSSQESLLSDRGGNGGGGAITYHQYYHVFREGELDQLINKYVENLHIISSYYDHASWCIVAEKVQVWTI